MFDFVQSLGPIGGGDIPEASKTGFNCVLQKIVDLKANGKAIVFHYSDAPPHDSNRGNGLKEIEALKGSIVGFDWTLICEKFVELDVPVISIVAPQYGSEDEYYSKLGTMVILENTNAQLITKTTLKLLMDLSGNGSLMDYKLVFAKNQTRELVQHPNFIQDISKLTMDFKSSEEYRDICFSVIANLLDKDPMTLTYNPIIGKIWRLMCKLRTDERLEDLKIKMSTVAQKLTGIDSDIFKEWLEESYNSNEEINKFIEDCEQQLPFVMLDSVKVIDLPNKKDFLSIARAPTTQALKDVQAVLTRIVIVKNGPFPVNDDIKRYIPLSYPEFFSIVSHLLCPGILFSKRPSILVAMMLFLNKTPILMDKAQDYLTANIGTWLDFTKVVDFSEIVSVSSAKF